MRSSTFCLPQSTACCSRRSPGSESRVIAPRARGRRSSPRAAGRVPQRGAQLGARVTRALVGAGDRDPQRLAVAAVDRDAVAQLAAGALAERAVVAGARRLLGDADVGALRPAVPVGGRVDLGRGGPAVGRHVRRVVVRRRVRVRQRALLAEAQRAVLDGGRVRELVARVRRVAEAPRVLGQQLGVGVDLDRDRRAGAARVGHLQADQRAAAAVGREVGALELQPTGGRQVELRRSPSRS